MPAREPQAVLQKLGQTSLKIDAFFLRQTGFIANLTVLKLGEYNLNCVPASLGADGGTFLAVLTASEASLFSRFKDGTHILILTFDNPDNKDIARFPLRVGLQDIQPVADRKNVCFLTLRFKGLPGEFLLFLGGYLEVLDDKVAAWDSLSQELLPGPGGAAVLCFSDTRVPVEITTFHTKSIHFQVTGPGPSPLSGPAQLRMVYEGRPLVLDGVCDPEGFIPEFHPDWVEFVEGARFQLQLKARSRGKKA